MLFEDPDVPIPMHPQEFARDGQSKRRERSDLPRHRERPTE
jgi:hypothetical protein